MNCLGKSAGETQLGVRLHSHDDAGAICRASLLLWRGGGGFGFNNLSIPSSVDPPLLPHSSPSSSSLLREQNVPASWWEEPMAGGVIYTEPRGGCCLPSNTGQGGGERGEREGGGSV